MDKSEYNKLAARRDELKEHLSNRLPNHLKQALERELEHIRRDITDAHREQYHAGKSNHK